MTSAQNHLPPSNGNNPLNGSIMMMNIGMNIFKVMLVALVVMQLAACNALKPAQDSDNKDNKDDDLEAITGNNDNDNTSDNGDIVREVSKPEAPDTIRWIPSNPQDGGVTPPAGGDVIDPKDPNNPVEPNNTNDSTLNNSGIPTGMTKGSYQIAVLLPLYTDEFSTTQSVPKSAIRSLNFYEGVLMGLRGAEGQGANFDVNVYDTRVNSISSLMDKPEVSNADFIIGPVSANNVVEFAKFAKENGNIMLSMNSSEGLATENPYYIQASPSFSTHCAAVAQHVNTRYPNSQAVLLGRSSDANSFSAFQDAYAAFNGSNRMSEYIVGGSSVNYDIQGFTNYLSKTDTNVVIIPSNNQAFVKAMLRELTLIYRTYPIVVFGLPRWESFYQVNVDHFSKLNVHITNSAYIDRLDPNVQTFKLSFYNEYGAGPTVEAFKGYDFASYFARLLNQHGTNLLQVLGNQSSELLHSQVSFQPVYIMNAMGEDPKVDHFENRFVNILRYRNYKFVKVN